MSIYLGDIPLANNSVSRNIGEIIQSTIPLSDAGLHLLDGALINGTGSYSAFVTYIAGLVSNYPDLFITETDWQQSITNYGVCGKFVYDSTNNTVRLPKITGFTEGTIDPTALGDLVEAGLPNIEGRFGSALLTCKSEASTSNLSDLAVTGAFEGTSFTHRKQSTSDTTTSWFANAGLGIDASRSSSIYGNSTTVQPQSVKVLYYIVVANSVKTDIEVDIDEVMTDLNAKVDKADLSPVQCVVETYVNGTSWYRIWSADSNGYWIEQGGYCSADGNVTYLKQFKDTNYTLVGGLIAGDATKTYEHMNLQSQTVSGFNFQTYDSYKLKWYACGYGE